MSALIEQYLEQYAIDFPHFEEMAESLRQKCDALCKEYGIKAIITARAKGHSSLKRKLYKRDAKKRYVSKDDVNFDIPDLCGARIALYYPGDRKRTAQLILQKLNPYSARTHPDEDEQDTGGGVYHAQHHRALFNQETLGERRVEIQISSVLMHAWAEIGHDDIYHESEIPPSADELSLSKDINALVQAASVNVVAA